MATSNQPAGDGHPGNVRRSPGRTRWNIQPRRRDLLGDGVGGHSIESETGTGAWRKTAIQAGRLARANAETARRPTRRSPQAVLRDRLYFLLNNAKRIGIEASVEMKVMAALAAGEQAVSEAMTSKAGDITSVHSRGQ